MSEEKALLAAIWANPLDDAPRLVYADWLDEHGAPAQVARAEFIRVQCELELLSPADSRFAGLEAREQALIKERKKEWLKSVPKKERSNAEFWRGFPIPTIRTDVPHLIKLTERDLQSAPLWYFRYGIDADQLDSVLNWPQLHRITTFPLRLTDLRTGWAKKLAACEGLRNVTELTFSGSKLSRTGLKTVLDAWTGRRLRMLLVNHFPLGDAGLELIATHPATATLRRLYYHSTQCTGRGMKAVADNPNLDGLRLATFAHNKLGTTGARHLLRWKALDGIRELYLMNTRMPKALQKEFTKRLGERAKL